MADLLGAHARGQPGREEANVATVPTDESARRLRAGRESTRGPWVSVMPHQLTWMVVLALGPVLDIGVGERDPSCF